MHAAAVEEERAAELAGPLRDLLPPVDFCCAYGSTLLHARPDRTSMVDYILGVADPLQWHSEVLGTLTNCSCYLIDCDPECVRSLLVQNLERNPAHYSRWMRCLGSGAVSSLPTTPQSF